MNIFEKLNSVGIKTNTYARGPLGKNNFAISRRSKEIYLWPGDENVTIEVKTNKRKRQALINVTENKRSILSWSMGGPYIKEDTERCIANVDHWKVWGGTVNLANRAWIAVPRATGYLTGKVKVESGVLKAQIKLVAPKTKTSFLVGFDEKDSEYPFICQLKRVVSSVDEAHKERTTKKQYGSSIL